MDKETYQAQTAETRPQRIRWWQEARFGMFVHWGLYAQLGRHEWVMNRERIPVAEYEKLADTWHPTERPAREWAALAKQAGMKYMVLTTKHHEGFCLWDSQYTEYKATRTPAGRDLLRPMLDAFRNEGLRTGLYHSVIDWHHDQYAYELSKQLPHPLKGRPYPNGQRDHAKYVKFLHAQVNELVSNYGPVDILWWDYSSQDFQGQEAWRAFDLMAQVRAKQPKIVMNNRLFRIPEAGFTGMGTAAIASRLDPKYGDFITPEQHIPATGMPGVDWETCMTMNTTWGYSEHDHDWKANEMLIRNLIDIASKGGNYLLNIGPKADGSVPPESVRGLQAIGAWMKTNGESIYATAASPFQKLDWGRCTQKKLPGGKTRLYLHVFAWPADGKLVVPLATGPAASARLLAGGKPLVVTPGDNQTTIAVGAEAPDKIATVIELDVNGQPKVAKPAP